MQAFVLQYHGKGGLELGRVALFVRKTVLLSSFIFLNQHARV